MAAIEISRCSISSSTENYPVYRCPRLRRQRGAEWAERGEITLEAAAKIIVVRNMTALRTLRRGAIKGRQVCSGAPWRSRPPIWRLLNLGIEVDAAIEIAEKIDI